MYIQEAILNIWVFNLGLRLRAALEKGREEGLLVSGLGLCSVILLCPHALDFAKYKLCFYSDLSLLKPLDDNLLWGEYFLCRTQTSPSSKRLIKPSLQLQTENNLSKYKFLHCVYFQWYFRVPPTILLQAAILFLKKAQCLWKMNKKWNDLSLLFFNLMFIFSSDLAT